MLQTKISIEEPHAHFLNNFKEFGFKDKSSMVRAALAQFKKELELIQLKRSADLYSEIYEKDSEMKELTESAIHGWPE